MNFIIVMESKETICIIMNNLWKKWYFRWWKLLNKTIFIKILFKKIYYLWNKCRNMNYYQNMAQLQQNHVQ